MKRLIVAMAMLFSGTAQAEVLGDKPAPVRVFSEADIAAIARPNTAFTPNGEITGNYHKYHYFHREGTGFNEAYADVVECDAYASGISYQQPMAYFGNGYDPAAQAFGNLIWGSDVRRELARNNRRFCMGVKGYSRYGLDETSWKTFNLEEGNSRAPQQERDAALAKQALIASGPKPEQEALEP
jgi:hypothetical protein